MFYAENKIKKGYKNISKRYCVRLIPLFALIILINLTSIQGQSSKSYEKSNIQEQQLLLVTTIRNNISNSQELKRILKLFLDEDPANLELLLDIVIPESMVIQNISSSKISELIEQLSSDNYSDVKNAILELYMLGPVAEPQIKKKYEASANPLEAIFLQGIISRWELTKLNDHECSQIQNIVSEYITGLPEILTLSISESIYGNKSFLKVAGFESAHCGRF